MLLYMDGMGPTQMVMVSFLGCLPLILVIAALIDILRNDFRDSNTKLIWVIVVIFVPVIGSLLYFILGASQKMKRPDQF